MARRLTEWEKTRILERQNYKCAMCGKTLKYGRIHFDHKKPLALGGKDDLRNIQALCPECHHIKTKRDRHLIAKAKKRKKKEESSLFGGFELPKIELPKLELPKFDFGFDTGSKGKKKKGKKKKKDDFWSLW